MRHLFFLVFLVLFSTLSVNILKSQVLINELLASNTSTITDNVSKNYVDWIELYNSGNKRIDLGGWFLTDNINEPTRWKIPYYISISPKSHEIFWADKLNVSNHTNFKLDLSGESVYLFTKDTILADSVLFPKQVPDISFGRLADTSSILYYFYNVSPGSANPSVGVSNLIYTDDVILSKEAGFYKKSLKLKFVTSSGNQRIFYTLDGSIPSENSNLYTKPVGIEKSTVVRARAFSIDKLPSTIKTATFFISESFSLPAISLSTDSKNLWDKEIGIYTEGSGFKPEKKETANYFQNWERPVNVEFFNSEGKIEFSVYSGMKIHGRSTRNYPQKTLAIYLKKKYGNSSLEYKVFSNDDVDSFKTFLLRNSGNDWGATMFLDALTHSLVIGKIDIDAQAYQPAIVFINGEYWGIHNIREKVNKHYFASKYKINPKSIDIIEADAQRGGLDAASGDMNEFNKLLTFFKNNDISNSKNFKEVKKNIDINECINYHIVQVFIANADWPSSNLKIWKEQGDDDKWRWILYDTEYSFGAEGDYYKVNAIKSMLEENSDKIINLPWSNYLIRHLFRNKEFKNEFIQRTAIYLNTIFDKKHVFKVIDSLRNNIEPEIGRSFSKWGGIKQKAAPFLITSKSVSEWKTNIKQVEGFIAHRAGFVRKNFMRQFAIKDTISFEIKMNINKAGKITLIGYTLPDNKFKGQVFADIPIRIEAIPNEGYEFVKWKEDDLERNCTLIPTKDKKLTAIFKKNKPPLN